MPQPKGNPVITRDRYDAVLLDLDGVIADTASLHAASHSLKEARTILPLSKQPMNARRAPQAHRLRRRALDKLDTDDNAS